MCAKVLLLFLTIYQFYQFQLEKIYKFLNEKQLIIKNFK